jgi:hypothetical protein
MAGLRTTPFTTSFWLATWRRSANSQKSWPACWSLDRYSMSSAMLAKATTLSMMCRLLIDTAVCLVETQGGPRIVAFDFPLLGRPDLCPEERRSGAIVLHLDNGAFARKRAAAAAYRALAGEIGPLIAQLGEEVFRVECLRPVEPWEPQKNREMPEYERTGAERVAAGYYQHVIRYRQHIAPLADALRRFAETRE